MNFPHQPSPPATPVLTAPPVTTSSSGERIEQHSQVQSGGDRLSPATPAGQKQLSEYTQLSASSHPAELGPLASPHFLAIVQRDMQNLYEQAKKELPPNNRVRTTLQVLATEPQARRHWLSDIQQRPGQLSHNMLGAKGKLLKELSQEILRNR